MRYDRVRFYTVVTVVTMLLIFTLGSFKVSAEEPLSVSARSAIVYNGKTGEVLFEKNAYEQLPMASTTKIMSALIILERDDLDVQFTVDSTAIMTEGSSMGLQEGDKVTLRDLACGMLLPSGNDAANAAAVRAEGSVEKFVEVMNERAKQLGMENTHFVTPSGLDDYTDEHYSTAYDMALLTAEAMKNEAFREICSQEKIKLSFGDPPYDRWLINTNKLLRHDDIVGVKTGFTDKARRCLVSACDRENSELICVTLNAPDDWNDHMSLYDYCFGLISEQRIKPPADFYSVKVAGSDRDKLLCAPRGITETLLNGTASQVQSRVFIEPFVYAPVKEGDAVGHIEYYYNGRLLGRTDITAAESAELLKSEEKPKGISPWFERLKRAFGIG